jgi:hypothetical protein
MNEKLKSSYYSRESMWTEAFAVRDEGWLKKIHRKFKRMRLFL